MSLIRKINRKSMLIRESGRSSDFISPSFGYGCLLNCSYCYMKRHRPEGLDIPKNIEDILTAVDHHVVFETIDKPNQTDSKFVTYDISCNEDFALHSKYYDWEKIFRFFRDHNRAKATLATKIIPNHFLKFNPWEKVRIRFSLMPQKLSTIFEPNTPSILDRIKAINRFYEAGYDVHVNFSPVILYKGWKTDYMDLFGLLDQYVKEEYKKDVLAEVIFLTHNKDKHENNVKNKLEKEYLLWNPKIQEKKISEYGGKNVRYKKVLKKQAINQFKNIHNEIIPWNTIRYIF
jgi:spore photoproduct lyase